VVAKRFGLKLDLSSPLQEFPIHTIKETAPYKHHEWLPHPINLPSRGKDTARPSTKSPINRTQPVPTGSVAARGGLYRASTGARMPCSSACLVSHVETTMGEDGMFEAYRNGDGARGGVSSTSRA
jgi:hypothetical protein